MTLRARIAAALLATSTLLLAACAPQPVRPPVDTTTNAALARRLDHWQFSGKIAVHQANRGHSGFLRWHQSGDHYRIHVAGPFGTGGFTVDGSARSVTLTSKNQTLTATSPEQLIEKALGWHIPVSPLVYWVRGLPAPGQRLAAIDYAHGLPATLHQDGWQVAFPGFATVGSIVLPNRLILTRGDVKIIVVIKQWQLPDNTTVADKTHTGAP